MPDPPHLQTQPWTEGLHTLPAGLIHWGTLHALGQRRYRVTCGRCKRRAQDFTAAARPAQAIKAQRWALWRHGGWVCPPCDQAWHHGTEPLDPDKETP